MSFTPNHFYTLGNRGTGLLMSVADGAPNDGAPLVQSPQDGSDSQIFFVGRLNGADQIFPIGGMLALGSKGGSLSSGTQIAQWHPDDSPSQQFVLTDAGAGEIAITSKASGLVFGIANGSHERGAQVVLTRDTHAPDQRFTVEDAGGGYMRFRNKASGLVLGIADGSAKRDATLVQWTSDGTAGQQFLVLEQGDGSCLICPKNTLKVVGIAGGSIEPNARAVQWHPDGSPNQQFTVLDAPLNGDVRIKGMQSGLNLTIGQDSSKPGAPIVLGKVANDLDQFFEPGVISLAKIPLTAQDLDPNGALFKAMQTFCPEVRFHPLEKYFPYDIRAAVHCQNVYDSSDAVAKAFPTPANLVPYGTWGTAPDAHIQDAYYLSPPGAWSDPWLTGVAPENRVRIDSGDYKGGYKGGTVKVPMAVRGYKVKNAYWFDYLYFYPYNGEQILHVEYYDYLESLTSLGKSTTDVGHVSLDPLATHIGDFEHASVQVTADLSRIVALLVFNHGDPTLIAHNAKDPNWPKLRFTGSHPVLYSGLHSHATYHTPGHHLQDLGSDANLAITASPTLAAAKTCDWCDDGGAVWQGWEQLVPYGVNGNGTALPGFPKMEWTGFYPHRWGKSRTFTWDTPLHIYDLAKGVPEVSKLQLRAGIRAGLKAGNDKLTDGLGVSPPDWWMKGM